MKPDDIPQDIWDVSFNIADEWEEFDPLCIDMAKDIARAILAERERCAKVAEERRKIFVRGPDVRTYVMFSPIEVAAAIRKGD